MFREMEVRGRVTISTKSLDSNGVVSQSSVVTRLLKELLLLKSTEEHGYFLAVTKLKSIGNGEFEEESRDIRFPVSNNVAPSYLSEERSCSELYTRYIEAGSSCNVDP